MSFVLGRVGTVVIENPNKRLLLPSMSEGCRPFSRAGTTPLLGQLLSTSVPPTCLQFPAGSFLFLVLRGVSLAACSLWGSPAIVPGAQMG